MGWGVCMCVCVYVGEEGILNYLSCNVAACCFHVNGSLHSSWRPELTAP